MYRLTLTMLDEDIAVFHLPANYMLIESFVEFMTLLTKFRYWLVFQLFLLHLNNIRSTTDVLFILYTVCL